MSTNWPENVDGIGFQNLETMFKYRHHKNPEHEFVTSAALNIE
jgi:hypothetical protein